MDDKVFLYTAAEMYQTALGLGMLESRWEHLGLFRCAKSALVNLNAIPRCAAWAKTDGGTPCERIKTTSPVTAASESTACTFCIRANAA